jgi:hypothetical protein
MFWTWEEMASGQPACAVVGTVTAEIVRSGG